MKYPIIKLPDILSQQDKVIVFDGKCKLCNFSVRFIIKRDPDRVFKLVWAQSPKGQQLFQHFDMNSTHFDTMLYIDGQHIYTKSDAAIQIVQQLGQPWKALIVSKIIPVRLRDYLYDWIALNRYRFFGKHNYCLMPSAEHEDRFLGGL